MKKSTSKLGKLLRGCAMLAVFAVGSFAAEAQTFIYDGVVYKASGRNLTAQAATVKPANGDAPGKYTGDIVIPETIVYNDIEYTVTSVGTAFAKSEITSIVIGDGVTLIGRGAFQNCSMLKTVKLPATLTAQGLGGSAFQNCVSLEEISIPGGITDLSQSQVANCQSLRKITFEESEKALDLDVAFLGALDSLKALSEVVILRDISEKYMTSMDKRPFRNLKTLTTLTLGGKMTNVITSFFELTPALKKVTIGEGIATFGTNVFANSGIEEIALPNSLTVIPSSTFTGCKSLTKVTLGNAVTSIQDMAFYNAPVQQINIPQTIKNIGTMAFSGADLQGEIVLPETLTTLGDQAFAGNKGITVVTLPASLASMGNGVFANCTGITKYVVTEGNPTLSTAENGAVLLTNGGKTVIGVAAGSDLTTLAGDYTALGANAAFGASKLTAVNLPNCNNWGDHALDGTGITSLTLTGTIGRYVAANCAALTEITLDGTEIPYGVAMNATSLAKVNLLKDVIVIKQDALNGCAALEDLDLGPILAIIEADAFKGAGLKTITVTAANPAGMAEGVFTKDMDITVKVPVELVETYKNAGGWNNLNIVGDANLAASEANMGMPDGLYYAGTDGMLHAVYKDGGSDTYDVGGVPHTFQLAQFKNRIYGACAGQKFVYSATGAVDGDGKLFYISKVGGNVFQAVVLDNTDGNAYKDPFGLYVYGDLLYVNDRNVCIRKIPADAIALPRDFESWVENNYLAFYNNEFAYGCIKAGWAITKGTDAAGNPEPVYWVGMKYNGNGIYRFREEHVGTASKPGPKPENGAFLTKINPIFTTFHIDEAHGHMYIYLEVANASYEDKLVKGGLYRINVADLEANPNVEDFFELNPVLIDGSPVKYEGSSTNEHVGISQLSPDETNTYLYWCYRAPTQAEADANEAQDFTTMKGGKYWWADKFDATNPLHQSGIKRIKLGEANPEVEMVVPGVEGYGVTAVNYEGSSEGGVENIVVNTTERNLVYADGMLSVTEDAVVTVYNMAGLMVANVTLTAGQAISLDNLEAGVYIATTAKSVLKFVK